MNPLVSVVTRTMGRDSLAETAASIAAQTYRPLEWVVVDAAGRGAVMIDAGAGVSTRILSTGTPLLRSPAANAGIDAAAGRYIGIVDDDDLYRPAHVAKLVAALAQAPGIRVAYADVEVWSAPGVTSAYYSFLFSHLLLTRRNLFPLNAALFDATLFRNDGICVDESLDYFEDWDLLLQMARHTPFVRVPGTTAIYRAFLSGSGVAAVDQGTAAPRVYQDRDVIRARYHADNARLEAAHSAHIDSARAATAAGDVRAAHAAWKVVYLADPYDIDATSHFAETCFALGGAAAAAEVLRMGTEFHRTAPTLFSDLAFVLEAQGDQAGAASARARAAALIDTTLANATPGNP